MHDEADDRTGGMTREALAARVSRAEWLDRMPRDEAGAGRRVAAVLDVLASAPAVEIADLGRVRRDAGAAYAAALTAARRAAADTGSLFSVEREMADCTVDDLVRLAARDEGAPRPHRHGDAGPVGERDVWDWASVAAQDVVLAVLAGGGLDNKSAKALSRPWRLAFGAAP
jgi:hypothetical protein